MTNHPRRRVLGMALGAAAIAGLPAVEMPAAAAESQAVPTIPDPVPASIATFFNNDGIDTADAHDGDFDGSGYAFPGEHLTSGRVVADGVPYDFPTFGPGQNDNVVALGQQSRAGRALHRGISACRLVRLRGRPGDRPLRRRHDVPACTCSAPGLVFRERVGAFTAPSGTAPRGTDQHRGRPLRGAVSGWTRPATARPITLPTTAAPADEGVSSCTFSRCRCSRRWPGPGGAVRCGRGDDPRRCPTWAGRGRRSWTRPMLNIGTAWVTDESHRCRHRAQTACVDTVVPATIRWSWPPASRPAYRSASTRSRLAAGTRSTPRSPGTTGRAAGAPRLSVDRPVSLSYRGDRRFARPGTRHPDWFNGAKFGIFIHWGIYSVPAWAPVGKEYAEWYWQQMNNPKDPTTPTTSRPTAATSPTTTSSRMFTAAKFDPPGVVALFQRPAREYSC